MNGIKIFMEGGGSAIGASRARANLRLGMDEFLTELKQAARNNGLRWNLVCCGSRDQAFKDFRNFRTHDGYDTPVLLVDAEKLVEEGTSTRAHLQARDSWQLDFWNDENIHLMAQIMETWILGDPQALADYYRQEFNKAALPKTENLESVSKSDVIDSLRRATHRTAKGEYHKIRHASDLLKRISADRVRSRCPHCNLLFQTLGNMIEGA